MVLECEGYAVMDGLMMYCPECGTILNTTGVEGERRCVSCKATYQVEEPLTVEGLMGEVRRFFQVVASNVEHGPWMCEECREPIHEHIGYTVALVVSGRKFLTKVTAQVMCQSCIDGIKGGQELTNSAPAIEELL